MLFECSTHGISQKALPVRILATRLRTAPDFSDFSDGNNAVKFSISASNLYAAGRSCRDVSRVI